MHDGKEPVSVTVRRNGEILTFESVTFPTQVSGGHLFGDMDFYVYAVPKTVPEVIRQIFWQSVNTVTMIWESIFDLFGGEYTVNDLSGPVGAGEAIASAAKQGPDSLVYIVAFLTFNLGILNLLPLPALDGGRLFFQFIELIFRRPVNRKVEGYIHAGGLVLLLLLMGYVTFHDIWKLFQ
ncbi:MAG: site-2 protease family protein, partial [Clostridia bacterium]|nr:site-2 protease family protein [Clostridia bacterium]